MKTTKTVSISSGKGGVGKTTVVTNLAHQLAKQGQKVLIFDGDVGMANADIMFGQRAQHSIIDVLDGRMGVRDIILRVEPQVDLIPGGSGIVEFNRMSLFQKRALLDSVGELQGYYDWLLVDTAPGIADHVLYLNAAADEAMIIVTPDPASITDSYALIKVLHQLHRVDHFGIICNQVRDYEDGLNLFRRFNEVVSRFLNVGLDFRGSLPQDALLRRANIQQRIISRQFPDAQVSLGFNDLALGLMESHSKTQSRGGLQFFWEQVAGVA